MSDITEHFDKPRQVMFDELADELGEQAVRADLRAAVRDRLTQLYDNRDQLQER